MARISTLTLMTALVLVMSISVSAQQGLVPTKDLPKKTIYSEEKVVDNSKVWQKVYERYSGYDQTGHLVEQLDDYLNGHQVRTYTDYNAAGMKSQEVTYETWGGGEWLPLNRHTYLYDNQLNLLTHKTEVYEPSTRTWSISDQYDYEYEYDSQHRIINTLQKRFKQQSQRVEPERKTSYEYQEDLLKRQSEQIYNSAGWLNSSRSEYEYDRDQRIIQTLQDRWEAEQWKKFKKIEHTYQENNSRILNQSLWNGTDYVQSTRTTYQNDEHLNQVLYLIEFMENLMWKVLAGYFYDLTYDDIHVIQRILKKAGGGVDLKTGGIEWTNFSKWEYSDFFSSSATGNEIDGIMLDCYPNPATDRLTVNVSQSAAAGGELVISGMTGQVMDRFTLKYPLVSFELNLMDYPPGIYLVTFQDPSGIRLHKKICRQ